MKDFVKQEYSHRTSQSFYSMDSDLGSGASASVAVVAVAGGEAGPSWEHFQVPWLDQSDNPVRHHRLCKRLGCPIGTE